MTMHSNHPSLDCILQVQCVHRSQQSSRPVYLGLNGLGREMMIAHSFKPYTSQSSNYEVASITIFREPTMALPFLDTCRYAAHRRSTTAPRPYCDLAHPVPLAHDVESEGTPQILSAAERLMWISWRITQRGFWHLANLFSSEYQAQNRCPEASYTRLKRGLRFTLGANFREW